MYVQLSKNARLVRFNEDVILLNLKKDEYILLDASLKDDILNIFESQLIYNKRKYQYRISKATNLEEKTLNYLLEEMKKQKIIKKELYHEPEPNLNPFTSLGMGNINWLMDRGSLNIKIKKREFMEAVRVLIYSHWVIRVRGFKYLVDKLKAIKKKRKLVNSDLKQFDVLARALNQASLFFPIKVKCLEWAIALCFMAFKRGIKCNLVVGVQNRPFYAHAWVECSTGIVWDDPLLRERMAIILKEPFEVL